MAIVNQVMPKKGTVRTAKDYRNTAAGLGYNRYQQIGSIGGSVTAKALRYTANGQLVRQ